MAKSRKGGGGQGSVVGTLLALLAFFMWASGTTTLPGGSSTGGSPSTSTRTPSPSSSPPAAPPSAAPSATASSAPSGGAAMLLATGGSAAAATSLNLLAITDPVTAPAYSRDQWRHWDNITACWTVREQVLARDAVPGSLILLTVDGQRTKNIANACTVESGEWVDPYTGARFYSPSDIDIDHLVPLGEAHRSGGYAWSSSKKADYANDLVDPTHLVAVSASANRAKGDKDPAVWKPANTKAWCGYARAWIGVKSRWKLSIDAAENSALAQMLRNC